jgi:succinoglycan biosynthesis protein ExoM
MESASLLVAVCVATRSRPQYLAALLETIRHAEISGFRAHLIVVDNDAGESARPVVATVGGRFSFPVTYAVEPTLGIASARNRLTQEAIRIRADFIAFVDDDQFVEPGWLRELVAVAVDTHADVVAGRWVPHFEDGVPDWVKASGFWARDCGPTGSRATGFGTGNVLIRVDVMLKVPGPFDERQNLSGGEDGLLFSQFDQLGFRSVWCRESVVHERVPPSRATAGWMIGRQYRVGINQGSRFRAQHGSSLVATARYVGGTVLRMMRQTILLVPSAIGGGLAGCVVGASRLAKTVGRLSGIAGARFEEYRRIHGG